MNEGIIRRVDNLGRIVIAKEYRKANGWVDGTAFEEWVDNGRIILTPADNYGRCVFCGTRTDARGGRSISVKDKVVCETCAHAIVFMMLDEGAAQ